MVNSKVSLNFSSTLEDSQLTFQYEDGLFPDGLFLSRCYRNGSWIPNPSGHVCATSFACNHLYLRYFHAHSIQFPYLITLQPTVVILPLPQTVILSLIQALQRGQGSTEFTSVRMDKWKLKKLFVILMDNGKCPGAMPAPQSRV